MASSILLSNDVRTVLKATLMGGFGGEISFGLGLVTNPGKFGRTVLGGMITGGIAGGVKGLTSCIAAGDDAKTTAWNTLKGIAGGATIGGTAAAIGYGATKAGSKLLGTGVKACFIAGTVVLTAEGLKKIEDIRAGDRVYAKDVEGGKQEMKEVLQTFEREVDVLVHLWIGGEEIVTTQTHPFYVEGKGWTEARELTEEDRVLDSKNEKLRVEELRIEELREPVKVYNFEVEEYHTYYVGAAEVLVHNDNCGQGTGGTDDVVKEVPKTKPNQVHHYVSDKNKTYTSQFDDIAKKYNLDLDNMWNKELLPHQGRHPNAYHEFVLTEMKNADKLAQGNNDIFLDLYESEIKSIIRENPDMLYSDYWKNTE